MGFSAFVRQQLELLRERKQIGKSLEAIIALTTNDEELAASWTPYVRDIAESWNVSEVKVVYDPTLENSFFPSIIATPATAPKCDRCWRHVPDVAQNPDYPTVCLRCVEALDAVDFAPYSAPTA